jgi:hypothetical protein
VSPGGERRPDSLQGISGCAKMMRCTAWRKSRYEASRAVFLFTVFALKNKGILTKMATIFEHISLSPDNKLGHINEDGEIYGFMEDSGEEEYIGRVDYDEGVVYLLDEDEEIAMGWVDENKNIIASFEDEDVEIGFVKDNGDLHYYVDEDDAPYIGRVDGMTDPVEGAAAMLIFFEFEEEFEEEDDDNHHHD